MPRFPRLPFFRRPQRDFDDEIASHLAFEEDRLVRQGLSPSAARDAARRAFGNLTGSREHFFESRRILWIERLRQDVGYALRTLRRAPGFALTALVTLGIGIGVNTTLFSVLEAPALRPLPLRESSALVNVYQSLGGEYSREVRGSPALVSYQEYERYRDAAPSLAGLAVFAAQSRFSFAGDVPESVPGQLASCNYFQVLRVRMAVGRPFVAEECRAVGAAPVAVLGHGLWSRRFGADSSVVGRDVTVNGRTFTVVGVTEPGFVGTDLQRADVWFPVMAQPLLQRGDTIVMRDNASWLVAIGRLRAGASTDNALAELSVAARQSDVRYPGRVTHVIVTPATFANDPEIRRVGFVAALGVLGVATLVVLLVCANIMNLQLARASARSREVGVRMSLGAGRGRLIVQLLTESAVLSFAGGLLGLAVAAVGPRLLLASMVDDTLPNVDLAPDVSVFAYALVLSCLAAAAFGVAPALQSTRLDLSQALRGEPADRRRRATSSRTRHVLVGVQVGGSALLLLVAGLFVRGVSRAQQTDLGYATQGVTWITFNLQDLSYDAERARTLRAFLGERLRALPGVTGVTDAGAVPITSRYSMPVRLAPDGSADSTFATEVYVAFNRVADNYLSVMEIPLVSGRAFTERESAAGETPVVVSETFGRLLAPGGTAVGKRFAAGEERYLVTGIARNVQNVSLGTPDGPFMYVARADSDLSTQRLVVRHAGTTAAVAREAAEAARAFDPAIMVRTEAFEDVLARVIRPARVVALVAAAFGALATLLALVGIYGTVSYAVSQRTREIGVRVALGARPRDVTGLVVRQGMRAVLIGLTVGTLAGAAATQVLRALLFGLSPLDPVAFGAMIGVVLVAALFAVWRPARRAAAVHPMVALRVD